MQQLKVDLINDAYSKIRISGLTVLPSPSDLELSLTRLENIMSELDVRGIALGYNFEDDPDPNSLSNLPRFASDGISSLLATRLIPDFNKAVPPQLSSATSASMSAISGKVARDRLNQIQYPSRMPMGSGNSFAYRWSGFYYPSPIPPVDSIDMKVGETNTYLISLEQYLRDGETISSIIVDSTEGIDVLSSTVVGNAVSIDVEAKLASVSTVKITSTTSDARVNIHLVTFNIDQPPMSS